MTSVYVIGPEGGPYKIGRSADPEKRLGKIQTGNHAVLSILYSVETDEAAEIEHAAHVFLHDSRLSGEWFGSDLDAVMDAINRALAGERPPPRLPKFNKDMPEPVSKMDGQEMQDWRKRMGWTQEQAAARLGVERGTVNRYENGKREISQTVHNLCAALDVQRLHYLT